MKHQNERDHDRLEMNLANCLRESGLYRHVWEDINYRRGYVVGQIDILAQRNDGLIEFYEVKNSCARVTKAKKQYDRFKRIFKRPTIGYMASTGFIRRLE